MSLRPVMFPAAGVIALSALGAGAYAYWPNTVQTPTTEFVSPPAATAARPGAHRGRLGPGLRRLMAATPGAASAPALIAERQHAAAQSQPLRAAPLTITQASVSAPLDLRMPAGIATDVDPDGRTAGPDTSGDHGPGSSGQNLVISLNPNVDDRDTDPHNRAQLFNRNNGLRGFMAHNWLNERVGLQGGLAIKQRRLRADDSPLRDNVAVGMGLLLSF